MIYDGRVSNDLSTHGLTRRPTITNNKNDITQFFQLTASRGGRRWLINGDSDVLSLSTHGLTRRPTSTAQAARTSYRAFQLTASRGGRLLPHILYTDNPVSFNSRPHEEADYAIDTLRGRLYSFNSRPHEEADFIIRQALQILVVFQLTASRGGRPTPPELGYCL